MSVPEKTALPSRLVEGGIDPSLMLPPFFYKNLTGEGLFRAFSETIQRVGSEVFLLQTLRGGAGSITATGNVNPAMIHDLYTHRQDSDADDRQARITAVRRTFETLPLIASMKATIAWKRNDPQWSEVRPPLMSVTEEKFGPLRDKLDEIGYRMDVC